MHVQQIRFDDVFDVAAWRGDFSFRSRDRTEYGANLQAHVIPHEGSTLAIAFAEPGNWNTVLGWRDLATGKITLKQPTWSFWLAALADSILHGPFFIAGGFVFWGVQGALLAALASAGIVCFQAVRSTRLNRAVKRALSSRSRSQTRAPQTGT
jgi:hypothetical protein